MSKLRRAFAEYNAGRARESWREYLGGFAFPVKRASRKFWEVFKAWSDENVGNATDTVVNNDSPLPEEFYNA